MTPHPKPDPARGVFETMLVVRGAPVALVAHLERLEVSLAAVYGARLPSTAAEQAVGRARDLRLGRLRLTAVPTAGRAGPFGLHIEANELDRSLHFPTRPISLVPHQVSGGLGCHKWLDRAALPAGAPGEAPLLVDGAEVLEAAWANVFAVRHGAVFTPRLDGRILPGVTRATIVELARNQGIKVAERPVGLEELGRADEVFLTNSVRGIESADAVDGARLPDPKPVTGRLRMALQDEWGLSPHPVPAA